MPPKTKGAKWPNWVEVRENLEIPKLNFFILWIFICNKIILPLKTLSQYVVKILWIYNFFERM